LNDDDSADDFQPRKKKKRPSRPRDAVNAEPNVVVVDESETSIPTYSQNNSPSGSVVRGPLRVEEYQSVEKTMNPKMPRCKEVTTVRL